MSNILKKGLIFLLLLVFASVLFNSPNTMNPPTSATEIVEIIDQNSSEIKVDDENTNENDGEKSNFFVRIVHAISGLFQSIISSLVKVVSTIVSSFAS